MSLYELVNVTVCLREPGKITATGLRGQSKVENKKMLISASGTDRCPLWVRVLNTPQIHIIDQLPFTIVAVVWFSELCALLCISRTGLY